MEEAKNNSWKANFHSVSNAVDYESYIGKKFGRLTVQEVSKKTTPDGRREKFYLTCICDCGNEYIGEASNIRTGHTKSCGCLRKTIDYKSMVGKKYGSLKLLEVTRLRKYGVSKLHFLCKCDCGVEKHLDAFKVYKGDIVSCGCAGRKYDYYDYIGVKLGKLTPYEIYHDDKVHESYFKARCECGNETSAKAYKVVTGHTTSCGCVIKENLSKVGSNQDHTYRRSRNLFFIDSSGNKIPCKSSYEVIVANYLTDSGIDFEYEPETFKLAEGSRYTPDFYLKNEDIYLEVKGHFATKDHRKQIAKIKKFKETHNLLLWFWEDIQLLTGIHATPDTLNYHSKKNGNPAEFYANREYVGIKTLPRKAS